MRNITSDTEKAKEFSRKEVMDQAEQELSKRLIQQKEELDETRRVEKEALLKKFQEDVNIQTKLAMRKQQEKVEELRNIIDDLKARMNEEKERLQVVKEDFKKEAARSIDIKLKENELILAKKFERKEEKVRNTYFSELKN